MNVIEKIDALVAGITRDEARRMPPLYRQRLAQALRRVADMLDDLPKESPKLGLLRDLRDGHRAE